LTLTPFVILDLNLNGDATIDLDLDVWRAPIRLACRPASSRREASRPRRYNPESAQDVRELGHRAAFTAHATAR
jgi:hypothetical protein